MFNIPKYFRPKAQPTYTSQQIEEIPAPPDQVPDEYLDRLDAIHRSIIALEYQNSELARSMRRVETKLVRLGIAAGYPDAVSRTSV